MWFRNTERFQREPWGTVFRVFAWGAVIGVVVAIILSIILEAIFGFILTETGRFLRQFYVKLGEILEGDRNLGFLVLVVFVAPIAEELAKGLGILRVRAHINEMEDGIVYGASSGLGFAATENLLYGAVAYVAEGLGASLMIIGMRSFSSVLLHASASSAFGYGVARSRISPQPKSILPFFLLAVFMHGAYNFFASFGELFAGMYGEGTALIGFVAAVSIAVLAIGLARSAITREERRSIPQ
ncbi:MAG: PrsW family intramembrane metalloprotease [Candidatus Thermoplasmatota archaeon]|nr:PrsW family intramembrane metalloprotease [Candidatus Thermoplasmatota archaeon]